MIYLLFSVYEIMNEYFMCHSQFLSSHDFYGNYNNEHVNCYIGELLHFDVFFILKTDSTQWQYFTVSLPGEIPSFAVILQLVEILMK